MTVYQSIPPEERHVTEARDWVVTLAGYRESDHWRSIYELAVTVIPFVLIWGLAWAALSVSYWLTLGLAVFNAAFLLRLFAIQHDCGHASFFGTRKVNDWVGRCLGVVTLTPYDVWRRTHSIHHSGSGNLDRRGIGDIHTMTVAEYKALSRGRRFQYRVYRNPVTLFVLAPGYLFFIQQRLPLGLGDQSRYWISAMGTNAALFAAVATIWYFGGWEPLLLIFVPTTLLAATAGMWLFYVQHQFEETHWDQDDDWQVHDAALHGSSHYILPPVLQWFSANIGIHHVHHLYSRIPFYRLTEVIRDHDDLANANRMTIGESLECAKLHLWDEEGRQLLSFKQARPLIN
ncbi:MAG: fatty acid desaturase [Boseongicola sp.]|nr:MAG: fatty acid desaturase [Boseongicola sp.]